MINAGDPFPKIHAALEEVHASASYRWDNALRTQRHLLVVQYTIAGEGFYEDSAGRIAVPAGHAMLFKHGEASCYGFSPQAPEAYRLRFLAFTVGDLQVAFDHTRNVFGSVVRMPSSSQAAIVFDELFERFHDRKFVDHLQQSELLHRMLIEIFREQVSRKRETDPIQYGFFLLRDHFRSPVNLKTLAARCGVSREHFIREFSRRFGESPGNLLRRLRLEHARSMLRASETPVEQVALSSGFASSHSFGRAFHQHFGYPPTSERKSLGSKAWTTAPVERRKRGA